MVKRRTARKKPGWKTQARTTKKPSGKLARPVGEPIAGVQKITYAANRDKGTVFCINNEKGYALLRSDVPGRPNYFLHVYVLRCFCKEQGVKYKLDIGSVVDFFYETNPKGYAITKIAEIEGL